MKTFIYKMRNLLINISKGPISLLTMQEDMLKMHLGHNKIIGFENGLPVRSMIVPAIHSKPFIRSGAKLMNSMRYGIPYPGLTTIGITGQCNCNCSHCIGGFDKGKDLDAKTWVKTLKELSDFGVFVYLFLGGEPLMKNDLPEIIAGINKKQSVPVIFTNGSLLETRINELKKAGLNRIFISIDYASSKHDDNRKHKGLFEKVCKGIELAKKNKMLIGLSTYTNKERYEKHILHDIVDMANFYKVNEIFFIDYLPAECTTKINKRDFFDPDFDKKINKWIESLWNSKMNTGVHWYKYMKSYSSCGCFAGKSGLHISNNGDVNPCFSLLESFGNITKENIATIWLSMHDTLKKRVSENNYKCLYLRQFLEK